MFRQFFFFFFFSPSLSNDNFPVSGRPHRLNVGDVDSFANEGPISAINRLKFKKKKKREFQKKKKKKKKGKILIETKSFITAYHFLVRPYSRLNRHTQSSASRGVGGVVGANKKGKKKRAKASYNQIPSNKRKEGPYLFLSLLLCSCFGRISVFLIKLNARQTRQELR